MKPRKNLLLGSKSHSRQFLLHEVNIPFTLIGQDADETICNWSLPLQKLVESIASFKMDHVVLPNGNYEGDFCFVLTADTLSQDRDGTIQGKPTDREDAIAKIKKARLGSRLCTSFCLDKRIWKNGHWEIALRIQQSVHAEYLFSVPDAWVDIYLEKSLGLSCSNAIAIEGFGAQFLKVVDGSYSTVVGLPLFELREALQTVDFFVTE